MRFFLDNKHVAKCGLWAVLIGSVLIFLGYGSNLLLAGSEPNEGGSTTTTDNGGTGTFCSGTSCTSNINTTQITVLRDGTTITTITGVTYTSGGGCISGCFAGGVTISVEPPPGGGGGVDREIAVGPGPGATPIFPPPPVPTPLVCVASVNPTSGPPGTTAEFTLRYWDGMGTCGQTFSVSPGAPPGCTSYTGPTINPDGSRSYSCTATFSAPGTYGPYTVTVEDRNTTGKGGKKGGGCDAIIQTTSCSTPQIYISGDLYVNLDAIPPAGTAPLLDVDFRADVGGTATGPINYRFDCTNDGSYDLEVIGTSTDPLLAMDVCDYPLQGFYTARVRVERAGFSAENTVPITVAPPAPGLSCSFAASPTVGDAPLTVTFNITDSDPGGIHNNHGYSFGDGIHSRGGHSISHTYSTPGLYTASGRLLLCADSSCAKLVDCNPTINISVAAPSPPPPPPRITLDASPTTILRGQRSTLSWAVTGATDCTLSASPSDPDWGAGPPENPPIPPFSGSQIVSPDVTTTYTLTCLDGSAATASRTVIVLRPGWQEIVPKLFPFLEPLLALLR